MNGFLQVRETKNFRPSARKPGGRTLVRPSETRVSTLSGRPKIRCPLLFSSMSRGTKLWRGRTAPRRPRTDTTPAAVIFLGGDYPKIHTPTYISSLPTCVTCHARFGRTYPGRTGKRIKASTTQPAAITGVADRRGQCAHAADASWRRWAGDPTQQAAPHPLLAPREAKM